MSTGEAIERVIAKHERSQRVYVASSWRNEYQSVMVQGIRNEGIEVYDFMHPAPDSDGFHWRDVMPNYFPGSEKADVDEYLACLEHPIANQGFARDMNAMYWADTCVLVLPCGRSAHLELGWFSGQGRRTAILLDPDDDNQVTPELMYKMCDLISGDPVEIIRWLKGEG